MNSFATYSASRSVVMRMAFMLCVLLALASGLSGGLVRAGVTLPASHWLTAAVSGHAFLMICAFMGTVIGIERAVAVKRPLSFAAPIVSASGGLAGWSVPPTWLRGWLLPLRWRLSLSTSSLSGASPPRTRVCCWSQRWPGPRAAFFTRSHQARVPSFPCGSASWCSPLPPSDWR